MLRFLYGVIDKHIFGVRLYPDWFVACDTVPEAITEAKAEWNLLKAEEKKTRTIIVVRYNVQELKRLKEVKKCRYLLDAKKFAPDNFEIIKKISF